MGLIDISGGGGLRTPAHPLARFPAAPSLLLFAFSFLSFNNLVSKFALLSSHLPTLSRLQPAVDPEP
jgi:hypothetical protein